MGNRALACRNGVVLVLELLGHTAGQIAGMMGGIAGHSDVEMETGCVLYIIVPKWNQGCIGML